MFAVSFYGVTSSIASSVFLYVYIIIYIYVVRRHALGLRSKRFAITSFCRAQDQRVQDQECKCLERRNHGSCWSCAWSGTGQLWWELRQQLGDQFGAGAPLMPAPDGEGTATVRPLSTGEFSKWVKMILDRNGGLQKDCRISSHSCKATMLSFLAKFGAPIPDREILGGHTGRMRSVLTYSRDSLASPLRVLTSMLERIRQGSFDPNATRSGMMKDVKVEVLSVEEDDEPWEPVERQQQDLDEEAGEDLGSGSDTSSSSEEEQAAVTHAARRVSAPKAPAGTELRQHPKSRMLHLIQEDHKLYLLCGRKVEMTNGSLYKPPASLRWDTPCCSHCWRASNTPLTSRLR